MGQIENKRIMEQGRDYKFLVMISYILAVKRSQIWLYAFKLSRVYAFKLSRICSAVFCGAGSGGGIGAQLNTKSYTLLCSLTEGRISIDLQNLYSDRTPY